VKASSASYSPPSPVPEQNFGGFGGTEFLLAVCPSCHPTISVEALKVT